jgi:hypothetical protein
VSEKYIAAIFSVEELAKEESARSLFALLYSSSSMSGAFT